MNLMKMVSILTVSCCIGIFFNSSAFSGQINITEEIVKNISIQDPQADKGVMIKFKDGYFRQGRGADDPEYQFGEIDRVVFGDLTGEGSNDAAIIYWISAGTGKGYTACVLSGKNGKIIDYDGPYLGNSVEVKKFAIENKKLVIDAIYGEKGNWGNPTHIKKSFVLKNNKIVSQ